VQLTIDRQLELLATAAEMQVTEAIEGVKVYNLSAGKTLKEWLNEASTRHVSLKKSVRRVANQNHASPQHSPRFS
jgi:hypothetical protein